MSSEDRRVLVVVGFAALLCSALRADTPSAPPLGNAASFAVLGGSAVNNSGSTIVTGNLGVSPGNTISGFPPGVVKLGDTFKNDALAKAAHNDAGIAYTQLGSGTCTPLPSLSPPPGIYCISSPPQLATALTLDAGGDHDAVWIFQTTGSLTTAPGSCVLAINGAQPGNVFWQVGGSATLGVDSAFVGNLIAHDNITLSSGASAFGRLLALTGTVTLNSNKVTLCSTCNAITLGPLALPGGTVAKPYDQTIIKAIGGAAPYTFKVISGVLPEGLILTRDGVLAGALSGTPAKFGTFQLTVAATDSQGCSGEREYTIVIACPLTLSPTTLPDAAACVFYTQTISAMGGLGLYKYTASMLPIGLTLSTTTTTRFVNLSGTVRRPDNYTFTVTAEDTVTHCIVSRTYTLKVLCNVMVLPETLPPATCSSYCQTFTASCGTPPYTFSFSAGAPPAGLLLSSDGMFCGTPTAPGDTIFTVTATDARGCTGSRTYTLTTACHLAISPPALPNGSVNMPYSQQLSASCGTPPYTFEKVSGSLPPWLSPLPASGLLSGTPTTAGVYEFKVKVKDANGCTGTIDYTLFICPLTISPATLPNGIVGSQYGQPLADGYGELIVATDGSGLYTFIVSDTDLPPGLKLIATNPTPGPTAVLSGKPTMTGTFTFTVIATDTVSGCVGSQTYTIKVTCSLVLSPVTLPSATLNVPYNETITASGGNGSYTFSLVSGVLPPGLSLAANGNVSGTPTVIGVFFFCITATDTNGCTGTQCYTITVAAAVGGPTLSGWGMLVLSVLLAGAGLIAIRRGGLI